MFRAKEKVLMSVKKPVSYISELKQKHLA